MKRPKFLVPLALLAAAVSVAAFGATTSATAQTAQTGVTTLTGELLYSCSLTPDATFHSCGLGTVGTQSFKVRCRQEASGLISGKITWSVTGIALGPYPGTFSEVGTVEFGGAQPTGFGGSITNVHVSFHIDSPTAQIDGRKYLQPGTTSTGSGSCTQTLAQPFLVAAGANSRVRYEAIIKPLTGGSFADEGTVNVSVLAESVQNPFAADRETSAGLVAEFFISDLLLAPPARPTAKEQCKDEGFLIFGVFENQGDCVSFVSTHGKNEPGKNQPTP